MKRNTWVSLLCTVVIIGSVSTVMAQSGRPPTLRAPSVPAGPGATQGVPLGAAFTYQGSLKNNGNPVHGACDMAFRLYDDPGAGNSVGSPITTTVTVTNGLFTVALDFGNVFTGDALWLDMQVRCPAGAGAYSPLTPRQALTAAPYASYALGPWTTASSDLAYAGGRVGIGAAAPQATLNVSGTSWFQGDSTPLPAAADKGIAIGFGGDQGYIFGFDYSTFTPKNLLLQNPGGNVGIGTLYPTAGKLHVDGGNNTGLYSTSTGGIGVYAVSGSNAAVYGYSSSDYGVDGRSFSSIGVYGQSYSSGGVWGVGPYIGVQGNSTGSDANRQAVRGDNNGSATGYAGLFYGNTWVAGTLYKNAGAFRIDHPLDPANKYLNHSFVESPDMKNIYDGVITTDAAGLATVELPAWFEALNKDFRYQLTVIGQFAQAIVASEIKDNRFVIQTDRPSVKVSWQVTGIRRDPYAEQYRIPVEQDKPLDARGMYVYPEGYRQPHALSIAGQTPAMTTTLSPLTDPARAPGGNRP